MGFENQQNSKPEFQSNTALSDFAAATLTSPDTSISRAGDSKTSTNDSATSPKDDKAADNGAVAKDGAKTVNGTADTLSKGSDGAPESGTIDFDKHKLGELNEGFDYFKIGSRSESSDQKDRVDPSAEASESKGAKPGSDSSKKPSTPDISDSPKEVSAQEKNDKPLEGTAQFPDSNKLLSGLVESGTKELASAASNAASWLSPSTLFGKGEKGASSDAQKGEGTDAQKGEGTDAQKGDGAVAQKGDGTDAAAKDSKPAISKADQGAPHLEAQEKLFTDHWTKKPGSDTAPRTHESTFTTGSTADHPNGMTYKNIQYDAKGNVKSFETPGGLTQTRTSNPDAQGFANWQQTDKSGRLVPYSGAESSQWRDKISIDKETGVHHYIGSGKNAGAMFSRHPDGSLVESRPRVEGGKTRGMESTVELPDGSKVSRSSKWDAEKLVANNESVKVQEPKDKGTKNGADATKDGVAQPKDKSQTPKDKAEQLENRLDMLKPLMEPGSLDALKNISDLSISKTTNPNEQHVSLHLKNPVTMPAPHMRVGGLGPFGGSSAVPRDSSVQNLDFNVRTNNNPGQLDVIGIKGMNGASDVYGPRGRHLMTKASSTESMRFDLNSQHPHVDVKSSGLNHALRLDSRHLGTDGVTGKLLNDKGFQKQVFDGVKAVQNNVDSFKISQKSPGNFEGSINPKAKEIELNQKVPLGETGLHAEITKLNFNEKGPVNFNLRNGKDGTPELKFNKGAVTVGLKMGGAEMKFDVTKISAGKDKEGRPVAKVQFNGAQEFDIPLFEKKR